MNSMLKRAPLALAVSLASLLPASPVLAQEAGVTALEEVVVTARKRSENLQDVPIAVSAFSAADLAIQGVDDITDLQYSLPNTTLQVSRGTNTTLTAYIRGIGQQDPLWGFEPGVGIYVDEVYIARPQGAVLDVLDVESIEVLRGPQGTLYGKNTIGGALKYTTRRVSNEPTFEVEGTLGDYRRRDLKVMGSVPIIEDTLFISGGAAVLKRDGYGEFRNTGADNYNKDIATGHLKMEWRASDSLRFILAGDKTRDESNPRGGYRLTPSLVTGQQPYDDVYDSDTSLPNKNLVETDGASLTAVWDINDQYQFKSISAYREGYTYTSIDFDATAVNSFDVPADYEDNQTTQEFQLNYTGDRLSAVGGLYYYSGDACGAFDVILGLSGITLENGGCVDTVSYSAYFQGAYDISEKLSVSLGGRYTRDEKDASVYRYVYPGAKFPEDDGTIIAVQSDFEDSDSWGEFTPHVGVNYQFSDDVMAYASYTSGFKSGGYDMRANIAANPDGDEPFDPETVNAYEIGFKSTLWDQRLRLNVAAFFNDYEDMQVTVQRAVGQNDFASQVLNAGASEMKGLELEAVAAITDRLTLNATFGYIDAEFTELVWYDPNAQMEVDVADEWVISNTPEYVYNLGMEYSIEIGNWNTSFLANLAYRDDVHIFEVPSALDEDGYTLYNASIVVRSPNERWTIGLHGKNLTDEEYRIAGYNFAATFDDQGNVIAPGLGGDDTVTGFYGDPRTVAFTVNYAF
ncbi:TonB-dependent receptor [Parahaliea aestuarii]|uniref:TonB-dependent receptor n=1 Tax=Parahaliea aestuarii TaxID=1852021 RepID=A0A5C8ZZH3_9GAMM|nr:TonB-dependent receptor [Parahaliea aestuarii]TXS92621.1 TonB-dependent receptor [Parahaliea aestuarii]